MILFWEKARELTNKNAWILFHIENKFDFGQNYYVLTWQSEISVTERIETDISTHIYNWHNSRLSWTYISDFQARLSRGITLSKLDKVTVLLNMFVNFRPCRTYIICRSLFKLFSSNRPVISCTMYRYTKHHSLCLILVGDTRHVRVVERSKLLTVKWDLPFIVND